MSTLRFVPHALIHGLLGLVVSITAGALVAAEPTTGFVSRVYKDEAGEHRYSVFVPADYTPQKKWPVILFLHGAGERGTDGVLQTTVGLGPLVKAREKTFPFIVVFPQCEDTKGRILTSWLPDSPDGKRALGILEQVERDYAVDKSKEILTGWSMGGYGAWAMAHAFPNRWSAVAPISGGGQESWADVLKNVNLWAMHGTRDMVVRVDESRKMIEAIKKAGGHPKSTEFPDAEHDVWKLAYNDDALYAWMLGAKDVDTSAANATPLLAHPGMRMQAKAAPVPGQAEEPFIPELDIPRSLFVRLGNDMLSAVADSIPQVVPRDMLTGQLPDISDSTSSEGVSFNVYFSNISYSGKLGRAAVRAYAPGRLNIQLSLQTAQIVIGSTSLDGGRRGATAGPIYITIGTNRPIWLSIDVEPQAIDRRLRLKLLATNFSIPDDNWSVSSPAGVSPYGLFVTADKVSSGLVSGLYGSKGRIEQQVISIVPGLIAQLEKKLDLSAADKAIAGIWPLPVYRPRLRVWPEEVSTDEHGVSIVFGVTAAAIDPLHPKRWVIVPPVGPGVAAVPHSMDFKLGVVPELLGPLSAMLINADKARIHVLDTPSKALAQLVDPKVMAEAIPDLKRYGDKVEIWSEIVLVKPLRIVDAPRNQPVAVEQTKEGAAAGGAEPATDKTNEKVDKKSPVTETGAPSGMNFEIPKLMISIAIKPTSDSKDWIPYAEFEVDIRQLARPDLLKPSSTTRILSLNWAGDATMDVKGRFAPGYQAEDAILNVDRMKDLFSTGWKEFTAGGTASETVLPDIDLGYSKLRAADVSWRSPLLEATFRNAGVKISNASEVPLVYETKGPYSDWGGPFTLKPGEEHVLPIPYPLLFRSRTPSGMQFYTLPAGSHAEFRKYPPNPYPGVYMARESLQQPKPMAP